jgi:hypothetical protein
MMGERRYAVPTILALIAGLVGGFFSGQFSAKEPAFAESVQVLQAEKYLLIDKSGIRGSWTTDNDGRVSLTMTSGMGDIALKAGDQANSIRISGPSGQINLQLQDRNINLLLVDSRNRKRGEVGLEGLTLNAKLFGNAGQVLWSAP